MTWQVAVAISAIANVTTILVQRRYAQRSTAPTTFPPAVSYVCGVLPIGLATGFLLFPHRIYWSGWLIMLLAIGASSMAIATWTGFQAASQLTIAPLQTIGRLTSIVVVLIGWTVLGEGLTTYQWVGGTILLIAALLAIWAPSKADTASLHHIRAPGVLFACISAVALGISLASEKAALGHMQIGGVFLVGWTTQALAMVLLAFKDANRRTLKQFGGRELYWSTAMGLTNGLTGVFYVYAIVHSDNISLITAILSVVLPLTVFGAYLLLKEREHHKLMWLSLALCCIGLALSSL